MMTVKYLTIRKLRHNAGNLIRVPKVCLVGILFFLTLVFIPSNVQAAKAWEQCSNYDSADPTTSSSYDLDYICATQWSDEPNKIYFYLFFRTIISANQFNNSYGSWAAMTIDTNSDGDYDLYIRTTNQTLPYDRRTVPGRVVRNGSTVNCPVDVFTDLGTSAKWLGLSVNKDCVGINGIGLNLQGYAASEFYYDNGYDFAPSSAFYVGPPLNPAATTTTTTTTTTTVPKVQIPNAPSSVSISQLSETSLRITWLDNSTNEDGFLIQRNDTPVPAGTSISAWPYKTAANSPTIEYAGLTTNRSYCFSISSYNSAGSSSFTDSACYNLQGAVATTQTTAPPKSLSCDATRVSSTAKSVQIIVDTGAANAGKTMKFEVFKAGKWIAIGTGRTSKTGASALLANIKIVGKNGSLPIRGTQGSRFICEGNLS